MKPSKKIKKGIIIEHLEYIDGRKVWVESIVTRETKSSLWFGGMGYSSLRKTTFDNYPELYRVKI